MILLPFLIAWAQVAIFGLPYIPPVPQFDEASASGPHGFPFWVRYAHFFNFLFLTMLVRSGLSILMDHPRLYLKNDCTPGTEWIRFTPLKVPQDTMWTAKDDARISLHCLRCPAIAIRSGWRAHGTSSTFMGSSSPVWSLSPCFSLPTNGEDLYRRHGSS